MNVSAEWASEKKLWVCNLFLPLKDHLDVSFEEKFLQVAADESFKIIL